MNEEVCRIRAALESIAVSLKKLVEEGFTIYEHQEGPETKN